MEYFDVYSPMIKQLYSQVFWTGLAPVSLPQEIIERYDDKGMAVVVRRLILPQRAPERCRVLTDDVRAQGFELDQVRRDPSCERCEAGGACPKCDKPDISVPLTVVYNHHCRFPLGPPLSTAHERGVDCRSREQHERQEVRV